MDVDAPEKVNCGWVINVNASDPADVEPPLADMDTVSARRMVNASDPADVDCAFPVKSRGETANIDREPVDVEAPENVSGSGPVDVRARLPDEAEVAEPVRGSPGLMDSNWKVPGNSSVPEYPQVK